MKEEVFSSARLGSREENKEGYITLSILRVKENMTASVPGATERGGRKERA